MQTHDITMIGIFSHVLEEMAFTFVDLPMEPGVPQAEQPIGVELRFRGPVTGKTWLALPHALVPQLAANMLGIEPGEATNPEREFDAVRELLNICTGQLVLRLGGAESVFDLREPEARSMPDADWEALAQRAGSEHVVVEGFPVLIGYSVD